MQPPHRRLPPCAAALHVLLAACGQAAPNAVTQGPAGGLMPSGWRHPLCFDDGAVGSSTTGSTTLTLEDHQRLLQELSSIDSEPPASTWGGTTGQDLWNEYSNIFRYGNRNAASHLWATFVLERSWQMTPDTVSSLFSSFCPVSGSPVNARDSKRYRVTLDTSDGARQRTGFIYYCCWPCLCDTLDFLKVDTATVQTSEGPVAYWVTVMGNPCGTERGDAVLSDVFVSPFDGSNYTLSDVAREVRCAEDGSLIGATLSDAGFPIIGMLHDSIETTAGLTEPIPDATPGRFTTSQQLGTYNDAREWHPLCIERAQGGYASGMGEIFRQVASVSPVLNISRASVAGRSPPPSHPDPQPQQRSASPSASEARAASTQEALEAHVVAVAALAVAAIAVVAAGASLRSRKRPHAKPIAVMSKPDMEGGAVQ